MSWEDDLFALFDELEDQASALNAAERTAEVVDRSRAEYQQVTLASRLMASTDTEITFNILGIGALTGSLERVSREWVLVTANGRDWVISLAAVATVEGASVRSVPEVAWSPLTRLSFASALRRISEAGEVCVVHLRDGGRHEGMLRRIGEDFCELVEGEQRRTVLIAYDGIAAAQSTA